MTEGVKRIVRGAIRTQPFNVLATSALSVLTRRGLLASPWFITHFPRIGTVEANLPNGQVLKLSSEFGDDPIANQVLWLGWDASEPEAIRLFFQLALKAQTILDVGAYVGYFALVAALANPKAYAYCFEPVPELQERLKRNIELNQLLNRVTCIASAVGAKSGKAQFFRGGDAMPTCSSLSQPYARANCPIVKEMDVNVIQLDSWVQEQGLKKVDLVKMDVETGEPEVLTGMSRILETDSPDILCEVLHTETTASRLEGILKPYDYRFFLLTRDGPQPRDRIIGSPQWRTYLFSKRMAGSEELNKHGH